MQQVKSVPPLPMLNQFHVLSIDEIKEEDSETYVVPVAQTLNPKMKRINKKEVGMSTPCLVCGHNHAMCQLPVASN
jgi:hypothetical protein